MEDCDKWATTTLRVFSASLTPDVLAELLGVRPDAVYRAGEPISKQSAASAIRKTNAVFVGSGLPTSRPLEDQLEALLSIIEGCSAGLSTIAEKAEADVFCGFASNNGQGGFTLSPELLDRLAALKFDVTFDLYPSSAERASEPNAEPDVYG